MDDEAYVHGLANIWKTLGWGWCNWNNDGEYLRDMFFYLGYSKDSYTHIHIQWSYDDKFFNVIYKCNNEHVTIIPLENKIMDDYIQNFANFLQNCS